MMERQPFVLRLFSRCVPGDLREPIAGDLHEEYLALRQRVGGARASRWLWWQSLRLAIGVVGALLLTRSMTSLLFGISAGNPLIYLSMSLLLAAVALLAIAVPSSRATRIDPLSALRDS